MIMLYLLLTTFLMKFCNTNGRSVRTVRETILKNKSQLVTFHDSIYSQSMNFSTDPCKL